MLEKIKQNWESILEDVRDEKDLTGATFHTWIAPLQPLSLQKNVLTIYFPGDKLSTDYIRERYSSVFRHVIKKNAGITCDIRITNCKEE